MLLAAVAMLLAACGSDVPAGAADSGRADGAIVLSRDAAASLDGSTGEVFVGAIPTVSARFEDQPELQQILRYADRIRRMGVWTNADKPEEAAQAFAQAESLYPGDYLPDDLYADWSMTERERLRNDLLAMLLEAAHLQAQLGRYRQAIADAFHQRVDFAPDPFFVFRQRNLLLQRHRALVSMLFRFRGDLMFHRRRRRSFFA